MLKGEVIVGQVGTTVPPAGENQIRFFKNSLILFFLKVSSLVLQPLGLDLRS